MLFLFFIVSIRLPLQYTADKTSGWRDTDKTFGWRDTDKTFGWRVANKDGI